jgi:hypothetical protein
MVCSQHVVLIDTYVFVFVHLRLFSAARTTNTSSTTARQRDGETHAPEKNERQSAAVTGRSEGDCREACGARFHQETENTELLTSVYW